MKQRFVIAALATTPLCCVLIAGCDGKNEYVPPPPPTVTVSCPVQQSVVEYRYFTGNTEEYASVEIRARVKGFLQEVHFEEGDDVTKGQVLYTIDPREYDALADEANAVIDVAKASLKIAEARLERMEKAGKALAQIDVLDAEAKRDETKATLAAKEAEAETAHLNQGFTRVKALMDGRVGENLVDVGNLVGSSESTLLTTIVQLDPLYAYFDMSERDALAVIAAKTGAEHVTSREKQLEELRKIRLELAAAGDEGFPHHGTVDYADPILDAETGTLLIRGIFRNPYPVKLLAGLFVRIRTPHRELPNALLVPERALGANQSGRYLLVVDKEDVVHSRPVTLGQREGNMRVISSGISASDWIVVNGILRARLGAKVTPQRKESATDTATNASDKSSDE